MDRFSRWCVKRLGKLGVINMPFLFIGQQQKASNPVIVKQTFAYYFRKCLCNNARIIVEK
jgi:hypothetical protein